MKILIVGGLKEAYFLTKSLKSKGHDITIINQDIECCQMLADSFEVIAVNGDGTSASILECACSRGVDLVIALNGLDSENLVVCEIAKKRFHVKETLAVVNDPRNIRTFENLGVDSCVSIASVINDRIAAR